MNCLVLLVSHVHPQINELTGTNDPIHLIHLIQWCISNEMFNKHLLKFIMHLFLIFCIPSIIVRTESGKIFLSLEPYDHRKLHVFVAEKYTIDKRLSKIKM